MESNISIHWVLFFTLALSTDSIVAQNSQKELKAAKDSIIKNSVEAKQYVFTGTDLAAQPVNNSNSVRPPLTIELKIYGDSIVYSTNRYSSTSYIVTTLIKSSQNSTFSQSEYSSKKNRKGGWDIKIKPLERSNKLPRGYFEDIYEFDLSISRNGYTTVTLWRHNNTFTLYYGEVAEMKY